jgi:D-glycero-alpha-D-manno-heptose 1-phosphate guanylyltransferase
MESTAAVPVMEAIILAGGLGTRLRAAVPDLPKCLAPVNGRPFLAYLMDYLLDQGVNRFIFSLGYKHEVVTQYLQKHYPSLSLHFSVEDEPLGTGGGIKLACEQVLGEQVLILNGDTLFEADLQALLHFHTSSAAACTLALKPMQHFDRYGLVEIEADNRILAFKEKQPYDEGLINGGIYALKIKEFLKEDFPEKFSFERDFLERFCSTKRFYGMVQDNYFIDIGIPEDYRRFAGRI